MDGNGLRRRCPLGWLPEAWGSNPRAADTGDGIRRCVRGWLQATHLGPLIPPTRVWRQGPPSRGAPDPFLKLPLNNLAHKSEMAFPSGLGVGMKRRLPAPAWNPETIGVAFSIGPPPADLVAPRRGHGQVPHLHSARRRRDDQLRGDDPGRVVGAGADVGDGACGTVCSLTEYGTGTRGV